MRAGAARGAAVGVVVGLVVDAALFLPSIVRGDTEEITDALVYMGLPVLVLATALGTLVGAARTRPPADGAPPDRSTSAVVALALVGVVLAIGVFAWGTGLLTVLG